MWIRSWLAQQMVAGVIKEARLKRKWSRRRLARRSGLSERTIWRVEHCEGTITLTSLILIALGLGETPAMFESAFDAPASALRARRKASRKAVVRPRRPSR